MVMVMVMVNDSALVRSLLSASLYRWQLRASFRAGCAARGRAYGETERGAPLGPRSLVQQCSTVGRGIR